MWFVNFDEGVVVFGSIEGIGDTADLRAIGCFSGGEGDHGAVEIVFFEGGEVWGVEEFDGLESDFIGGDAEVFERDFFVAPLAGGVVDVALESGGGEGFFCGLDAVVKSGRGGGEGGGTGRAAEGGTAGD